VPVDDAQMQRGDLVFFNTSGAPFSHMGLYVGGEQFVHAPSTGGTVRKVSLDSRYFAARYQGARRVCGVKTAGVACGFWVCRP
jgi:cell wall-associated NlpC family hydrolase